MEDRLSAVDALRERLATVPGSVVFVVGAGVSMATTATPRAGPPTYASWPGLILSGADFLAKHTLIDPDRTNQLQRNLSRKRSSTSTLLRAAKEVTDNFRSHPDLLAQWLQETVGSFEPSSPRLISSINDLGTLIITTNYDSLIEQITTRSEWYTWRELDRVRDRFLDGSPAVLHIHGEHTRPDTIILDPSSYQELLGDSAVRLFRGAMSYSKCLVFVGFGAGIADPTFAGMRKLLGAAGIGRDSIQHIRLVANRELKSALRQHSCDNFAVVGYGDSRDDLPTFIENLKTSRVGPSIDYRGVPRKVDLVGQQDVLTLALHQVRNRRTTIVRGPAGGGKTALAVTIAREPTLEAKFPDGPLWITLGRNPKLTDALAEWARQLGIQGSRVREAFRKGNDVVLSLQDAIRLELQRKECLLIIDDVWDADDASAVWLGGPGCAHLVTTNFVAVSEELRTPGDPGVLTIQELSRDEKIGLLQKAAPNAFAEASDQVRELLRSFPAYPVYLLVLGKLLEKAVAYGRLEQEIETLARSVDDYGRLFGAVKDLAYVPADGGKRVYIDTLLNMLLDAIPGEAAKVGLAKLTVFKPKENTFPMEAAALVAGVDDHTVVQWLDIGALERLGSRYAVSRSFWDHVWLGDLPVDSLSRAADFFSKFLDGPGFGEQKSTWLETVDLDLQNITGVAESILPRNRELALELIAKLGEYWYERSRFVQGLGINGSLLDRMQLNPLGGVKNFRRDRFSEREWSLASKVMNDAGTCAYNQGDMQSAHSLYASALAMRSEAGDPALAGSLNNVGLVHRDRGDLDVASSCFRGAVDLIMSSIAEQSAEEEITRLLRWKGYALDNLALLQFEYLQDYSLPVDLEIAEHDLSESERSFRAASRHEFGLAMVACDRARLAHATGGPTSQSRQQVRDSLRIRWHWQDRRGLAVTFATLAHEALLSGRSESRDACLGASLELAADVGEARVASECLLALAPVAHRLGTEQALATTTNLARAYRQQEGLVATRLMYDATRLGSNYEELLLDAPVKSSTVLESARLIAMELGAHWQQLAKDILRQ